MKLKILILNNGYRLRDLDRITSYIEEKTPLRVELTIKDVDIKNLSFKYFKRVLQASGRSLMVYGLRKGVKEELRPLVKEGEYHVVVFAYKKSKVPGYSQIKWPNYVASWSYNKPLYQGTEYIELNSNKALLHEMMHAMCKRTNRHGGAVWDQMDKTLVDGVWKAYYKDKYPDSDDGNYARTLSTFNKKDWEKVVTWWYTPKPQPVKKWKYFTAKEVVGLDTRLVDKLDLLRGECGFPFVITSGKRTPEQNKKAGGVADSAHLYGKAADIRIQNSTERSKFLSNAFKHFKRVGIGETFVHVDIDENKPQSVAWLYN